MTRAKAPRLLPPVQIRRRALAYREAASMLDWATNSGLYSHRVNPANRAEVMAFIRQTIVRDLRANADLLTGGAG